MADEPQGRGQPAPSSVRDSTPPAAVVEQGSGVAHLGFPDGHSFPQSAALLLPPPQLQIRNHMLDTPEIDSHPSQMSPAA